MENPTMKSLVLSAAILLGSIAPLLAQSTPRIDKREENQQDRIGAGIAKGDLTPREAINLERGQARIDRMENRAKADGVVTARERARINNAQNVESAKIYNKRHNARRD
jgi:uncharacterized membrane protein YebE (DUF533 family)